MIKIVRSRTDIGDCKRKVAQDAQCRIDEIFRIARRRKEGMTPEEHEEVKHLELVIKHYQEEATRYYFAAAVCGCPILCVE